ncbi:ABC transporter permease [Roseibium sp. HPY-6]|uniref:ABC transporter permease n=1 Tax=Roseibium sp. HPY-6 TaxID=3229852 RepID=UPI00338D4D53
MQNVSKSEHIWRAIEARQKRRATQKVLDWIRTKPEGGITVMFVLTQIVCICAAVIFPDDFRYLSAANISVTLKAAAPLGIIALGVGILMISGEFDLSVGALYSLCAILCGMVSNALEPTFGALAPFIGLTISLAFAACAGILHSAITLIFVIPSFITTLGAMLFWKGATLLVNGSSALRFRPPEPFQSIFNGQFGVVHMGTVWFLILALVTYFFLHHHRIGNHFFAVGGNEKAATAIGVNPFLVKTIAFAIACSCAAVAGVIAATRVSSVQPGAGLGLELQAIAGCVIGGVALMGGRGSILGIVLGSFLVFTIKDVLLLLQAPGFYFDMFVGSLIVFSVVLNSAIQRKA